jgi:hypothetical protein
LFHRNMGNQFRQRKLSRELSRLREFPNLYLAALVAVIVPNIVAIVAIAALVRRDLAGAMKP